MTHLRHVLTATCPETGKVYPVPAGGSDDPAPQPDPAPEPEPDPEPEPEPTPPWGSPDEFDPEKAWNLIQNLRGDIEDLKPKAARLKELEDADKTEAQKAAERAQEAEQRAEEAEAQAARLNAAVTYGLTKEDLELLDGVPADKVDQRAKKLAERLSESADQKRKPGLHIPREGGNGGGNQSTAEQFAAAIEGSF